MTETHRESFVVAESATKPQEIVEKSERGRPFAGACQQTPGLLSRKSPAPIPRDGATYDHARDGQRLANQHARVLEVMKDGREHTLAEISLITRAPEASVSARLRDLRKERFGAHNITRRYIDRGLFAYRLVAQKELAL